MGEYIEREKALDFISEVEPIICMPPNNKPTFTAVKDRDMVAYLESIPAADVRPAVRGHIEEDENTYLFCSECNCNITLAAYETPDNRLVLRPNYCPNCGAKMEGSE